MTFRKSVILAVACLVIPSSTMRTSLQDVQEMLNAEPEPTRFDSLQPDVQTACFTCLVEEGRTCFPRSERHTMLFGEDENSLSEAWACLYQACEQKCPMNELDYHTNKLIEAIENLADHYGDQCNTFPVQSTSNLACQTVQCIHTALDTEKVDLNNGFFAGSLEEMKTKVKKFRTCMNTCVSSGKCHKMYVQQFPNHMFAYLNLDRNGREFSSEGKRACLKCMGRKQHCLPHKHGKIAMFGDGIDAKMVGESFGCLYDECHDKCDMDMLADEFDVFIFGQVNRYPSLSGSSDSDADNTCATCLLACYPNEGIFTGSKEEITGKLETVHSCGSQCVSEGHCANLDPINKRIEQEFNWWAPRYESLEPQVQHKCFTCVTDQVSTCFPRSNRHTILFGEDRDAFPNAYGCLYEACHTECPMDELDYHTNQLINSLEKMVGDPDCGDSSRFPTEDRQKRNLCELVNCIHRSLDTDAVGPKSYNGFFAGTLQDMKTKMKKFGTCMNDCVTSGNCNLMCVQQVPNLMLAMMREEANKEAPSKEGEHIAIVFKDTPIYKCTACLGQKKSCLPERDGKAVIWAKDITTTWPESDAGKAFGCFYDACHEKCPLHLLADEFDKMFFQELMFWPSTASSVSSQDNLCATCFMGCFPDDTPFGAFEDDSHSDTTLKAQVTEKVLGVHACTTQCVTQDKCGADQLATVHRDVNADLDRWAKRATDTD